MSSQNDEREEYPRDGTVLWAWVGQDAEEVGVARLKTAWIPLGTINLAGFNHETMSDPRLIEALQEQADKDGMTVRLVKFVRSEETLVVRPSHRNGPGQRNGSGPHS